jgi:hypothetical protein
MAPLRRAGSGRAPDGALVTWTVAEGRRGRRWREVVVLDGAIVHSLLLELDPDGRFSHLELSTPAGLLTLHPEGDGTLHGNAVRPDGVSHVVGRPWDREAAILLDRSVVCLAAARRPDGSAAASGLRIAPDLSLHDVSAPVDVPRDGQPTLVDARSWPLEEPG